MVVAAHKKYPASGNVDPVDAHIGSRIRLGRSLAGMSQGQLGAASRLTFQQIQKYERGANRVSASRLFHFAEILGVDISYFFENMPGDISSHSYNQGLAEDSQLPIEDDKAEAIMKKRETLELVRAYYRISDPKQRKRIYELVKAMAEQSS